MRVSRYHSTGRAVVEIFCPAWTGGSARQCWFVAEFPNKEYVFITIWIDNEVDEVLIVERVGQFWREILPVLSGMSD